MTRKIKRTSYFCEKCESNISKSNWSRHVCNKDANFFKPVTQPKSEIWYNAMTARQGIALNQFTKAEKEGRPKPIVSQKTRNKISETSSGRKHSDETKILLSEIRKDFLLENPDMVPYRLNHYSKGRSYPEQYWKEILDNNNINYEEQYQISYYQLDFALLSKKIDLEIDGDQHYLDPKIVESDNRRTKFLENLGWTVIRIKWSDYKKNKNKEEFIKNLIKRIS